MASARAVPQHKGLRTEGSELPAELRSRTRIAVVTEAAGREREADALTGLQRCEGISTTGSSRAAEPLASGSTATQNAAGGTYLAGPAAARLRRRR